MSLSVVVPTFNEANRVPATLTHLLDELEPLLGRPVEVVLSDDGSIDDTLERVRALPGGRSPLRILEAAANRGKGGALASGFGASTGDLVLFLDADLPVSLETICELVEEADATRVDLLVGSRRIAGAQITEPQPLPRRIGGAGFRLAATLLGYRLTTDPQCGVKLLRRTAMAPVVAACTNERFAFDIELISRTGAAGLTVAEHPVDWHHVEGSSLRPVRDAAIALWDLARLRTQLPATGRASGLRRSTTGLAASSGSEPPS